MGVFCFRVSSTTRRTGPEILVFPLYACWSYLERGESLTRPEDHDNTGGFVQSNLIYKKKLNVERGGVGQRKSERSEASNSIMKNDGDGVMFVSWRVFVGFHEM